MTNRRGASLAEVLVAVVVLSIGLTSVVALFPVGISRIRNATLDTRTTIIAANAINTFDIKRMANDPGIVDWPIYDNYVATNAGSLALDDAFRNPLSFVPYSPGAGGWNGVPPCDYWEVYLPTLPTPNRSVLAAVVTDKTTWEANKSYFINGSSSQVLFPGGSVAVTDANAGYDYSYPVLLDPWLYDQMAFTFGMMDTSGTNPPFVNGVPRIAISSVPLRFDGTAIPGLVSYYGGNGPYCDIAILSLSEMTLLPTVPTNFDREMVKTRWFSSMSDLQFSADTPGQLINPSSSDYLATATVPLVAQNYYEALGSIDHTKPIDASNPIQATASRSYEYTWAAMFQRKLVTDPLGVGSVARPNPNDREFRGKVSIMCFYRRNLQQPYTVIEGCFYNGSRRATLSWPATVAAPTINIGTWLCEASVSRSTAAETVLPGLLGTCSAISGIYINSLSPLTYLDGTTPLKKRIYRRSYSFHQVTDVTEPVEDTGRIYVQVTLARPAIGYPLRYQNPTSLAIGTQSGQDERGIDPYPAIPTWPIFDVGGTGLAPNFDDETNCSQAQLAGLAPADYGKYSFYFPVIIFDGLREVFEYER